MDQSDSITIVSSTSRAGQIVDRIQEFRSQKPEEGILNYGFRLLNV
jgi:hypothetical protein